MFCSLPTYAGRSTVLGCNLWIKKPVFHLTWWCCRLQYNAMTIDTFNNIYGSNPLSATALEPTKEIVTAKIQRENPCTALVQFTRQKRVSLFFVIIIEGREENGYKRRGRGWNKSVFSELLVSQQYNQLNSIWSNQQYEIVSSVLSVSGDGGAVRPAALDRGGEGGVGRVC